MNRMGIPDVCASYWGSLKFHSQSEGTSTRLTKLIKRSRNKCMKNGNNFENVFLSFLKNGEIVTDASWRMTSHTKKWVVSEGDYSFISTNWYNILIEHAHRKHNERSISPETFEISRDNLPSFAIYRQRR